MDRPLARRALRLGALLCTLTPCATAFGHGEPPVAYTVITHDAEGARAVRLSAGVAVRRAAQRFQFVCPSVWGDMYGAPVAALSDGTIVVGATSGLMLLGQDGSARPHPDPNAVGDTSDVVSSALGVFALRATPEGSELIAADATKVRTLWKDSKTLYSLAAFDDKLVLLRANGATVEQVTVAASDGKELERQVAAMGSPVDYVFARAAAGAAYAVVMLRSSTVLGSLHMNSFSQIAEGQLSVAGPLRIGEGTLVALDGKLSQLAEGKTTPLAEPHNVLCLEQNDGLMYACDSEGIARVSNQALGEPLFQFSWLAPPDLELVPEGMARTRCNTQWQDLRVDLFIGGTTLPEDAAFDAGSPLADAAISDGANAMAGADDAGLANGAAQPSDAGIHDAGPMSVIAQPAKANASCATLPWRSPRTQKVALAQLVLALALARRRRRATR